MRHNTDLNDMAPFPFCHASWGGADSGTGRFDLVIGADVLYEHDHPRLLAAFLALPANPIVLFVMADAGRGHCGRFNTQMQMQGYTRVEKRVSFGGWPPGFLRTRIRDLPLPSHPPGKRMPVLPDVSDANSSQPNIKLCRFQGASAIDMPYVI